MIYRTLLHSHWIEMVSPIFPLLLTLFLFSLLHFIPCEHTEMTKVTESGCFYFCDLLQESNLVSSAAVCVASGFIMSIWILCACVYICTYTHLYMYNIYTIYMWVYI